MIDVLHWLANEAPKIHPLLREIGFFGLLFASMLVLGTIAHYIGEGWHKIRMELHAYREFKKK